MKKGPIHELFFIHYESLHSNGLSEDSLKFTGEMIHLGFVKFAKPFSKIILDLFKTTFKASRTLKIKLNPHYMWQIN